MLSTNASELLWVEKFRPKKVSECILPAALKKQFQQIVDSDNVPNMLFVGSPGSGKTTVARAIPEQLEMDYILINGNEESGIDTLRTKIRSFASAASFSGKRRLIIIDEAEGMNANSLQPAMRAAIEEFSANCAFILTTNTKFKIIDALQSRCPPIEFKISQSEKPVLMAEFHRRVMEVLQLEGVKCSSKLLVGLISNHFPDFRRILGLLQNSTVDGAIPDSTLIKLGSDQFKDLIAALKAKDFQQVRSWIAENSDTDQAIIIKQFYDSLYDVLEKDTIVPAVLISGKYLFQAPFTADQEINLACYFLELMAVCRFK